MESISVSESNASSLTLTFSAESLSVETVRDCVCEEAGCDDVVLLYHHQSKESSMI